MTEGRSLESPDGPKTPVRERAKSAALVVAILTILVGSDPLDIRNASKAYRGLDYGVIVAWIVAILLFLVAQTSKDGKTTRGRERGEFWLQAAQVVAVVAAVATIAAIVGKAAGIAVDKDVALLSVDAAEQKAFTALCGSKAELYGTISTGSLNDEIVVLRLNRSARSRCDEIRLPRASIVTIVEHPCKPKDPKDQIKPELCPSS